MAPTELPKWFRYLFISSSPLLTTRDNISFRYYITITFTNQSYKSIFSYRAILFLKLNRFTTLIITYNMQNTLYQLSFWQQRWIMEHLPPLSIPTWNSPHYQQYTPYHHTYSQPSDHEPHHQDHTESYYRYDTESYYRYDTESYYRYDTESDDEDEDDIISL
jgi:hypothetical protein